MADTADNAGASSDATRKPWGDDANFDAERAWTLIQGLRSDKAALTQELATVKTERDTAVEAATQAQKDLASDRREAILKEFDIDEELAELFLGGDLPADELRRRAERLAGVKKPAEEPKDPAPKDEPKDGEADKDQASDSGDPAPKLPSRPKPRQTPGEGESGSVPVDLDAIATAARQR